MTGLITIAKVGAVGEECKRRGAAISGKILVRVVRRPVDHARAAARPDAPAGESEQIKGADKAVLIIFSIL